ncbi:MAG: hypothetical protein Q9181_007216 [Wetmoreana brouardii]
MADYTFGGTDEENAELKKLNAEVLEDPDSFENWEKLVRAAESLEGGLNRNSSPQSIVATRDIYDRFLAKFPLLFGYWKKYADLEFSIAGTEAAELVYERGVASITNSVDLWTNYCSFKVETSHDPDLIRELFERGATCVGLDFLAHPFWDKYLEFEERVEAQDKIFAILDRVVHIPMHQYARYFERYRHLAQHRPLPELLPADMLTQFRSDIENEGPTMVQAGGQQVKAERGELEIEREMRTRIDNFHLEIFSRTQTETTKRWTYESEIKRPYFHVTELDEGQLVNWRKYLDFEEVEGDYSRTQFLYERCLVTCAYYDEFWLRYARWMLAMPGKEEEVRNIYQRASMLYAPISRPAIRLHYAYFEETCDRVELAKDIHQAVLLNLPGHIETIVSLANMSRRHGGLEAAIEVYKAQIEFPQCDHYAKAALCAEWARLLWKIKGSVDEARKVFQQNAHWYLDSRPFWIGYLFFELEQPTSAETEATQYKRIKQVHDDIRRRSQLPTLTIKDLSHYYMAYLLERGTKGSAKEYMTLDREINGPFSVQTTMKQKLAEDGRETTTQRRMMMENGHPGVEVDEAAIRRGENPYTKYYQQQGEQQLPSDAQYSALGGSLKPYMLAPVYQDASNLKAFLLLERIRSEIMAVYRGLGGTTVRDPHFSSCVRKKGNPGNLPWDSDPSCWLPNCDGPSGIAAPSRHLGEEQEDEEAGSQVLAFHLNHCCVLNLSHTPENSHRKLPSINDILGSPCPYRLPSFASLGLPKRQPEISSLTMNQTANVVIAISREQAGKSDEDTVRMWDLWMNLLPQDVPTTVQKPEVGATQKQRQQAIVWLAQDVYTAFLAKAEERFLEQLKIVKIWKDLARYLDDVEGTNKIHELMVAELGEDEAAYAGEMAF